MSERDLEPVRWIASSLRDLKSFPTDVQRSVGFNLFRAQEGKKAPTRVYVLHSFQKESRKGVTTPKHEIDLIRRRYEMARAHHDQSQEDL